MPSLLLKLIWEDIIFSENPNFPEEVTLNCQSYTSQCEFVSDHFLKVLIGSRKDHEDPTCLGGYYYGKRGLEEDGWRGKDRLSTLLCSELVQLRNMASCPLRTLEQL